MLTWLLITGLCLMCWGVSEKYPLSIFAAGTFLFHALDSFVGDSWGASYYVVAASTDLLIMYFISISIRLTVLALGLMALSFVSIVLNFTGWVMYESYWLPDIYNLLYVIFYGVALLFVIIRSLKDGSRTDGIFYSVRGANYNRG